MLPLVVPLKPEEAPSDLKCAICFGIPLDPAVTRCEHVFCWGCIHEATAQVSPLCPICRKDCHPDRQKIRRLASGTVLHRIWSGIPVKCAQHEHGCAWTGTLGDARQHADRCQFHSRYSVEQTKGLSDEVERLRHENQDLKEKVSLLEDDLLRSNNNCVEFRDVFRQLRDRCSALEDEHAALREQHAELKKKYSTLQDEHDNPSLEESSASSNNNNHQQTMSPLPVFVQGRYEFHHSTVAQLTQLMARHVRRKPPGVQRDWIFDSLWQCYKLVKWRDAPDDYRDSVRTLLSVASSCKWLTDNQQHRICCWQEQQNWG